MPTELIVDTPEKLRACCTLLATERVIGFDTEFVGEATFVPDLCLLQIATPTHLFLVDPMAVNALDELWKIVGAPQRTVVVHAGREEIRLFHRATGRVPENFFDLQIAAGLVGYDYPLGHGTLVRDLLGTRLHKAETLTDWRKRPLTAQQIDYAFDDVRYSLALWQVLGSRLEQMGRVTWEREEVAYLLQSSMGVEPGIERWRKLKSLGTLDRKKLAVVKAVFEWRERVAAHRNRPVRSVLRDDLIVEIARRLPKSANDVEMLRGVPKRDAAEIFQIVVAVRNDPAEQWPILTPREDDEPHILLLSGLLNVVLADRCARLNVSPKLVANASDIRHLVRSAAVGATIAADSVFATGWRATAILPELQAVLHGRRRVRVHSLNDSSPLEYSD